MKHFSSYILKLYCIFIIAILPLIFHNSYYDIRDIKVFAFWLIYCIVMIFLLFNSAFKFVKQHSLPDFKNFDWSKHRIDLLYILFFIIVFLSSLCSRYGFHAFTGDLTFKVGGLLLMAVAFMFLLIHYYQINLNIYYIWIVPALILEVTAILNSLDIDPLRMHTEAMGLVNRTLFISTIGQINYTSQYFCLFIPLYMAHYLDNEKTVQRMIDGVIITLGFLAAFLIRGNTLFLGLFFVLIFIWLYSLDDMKKHRRLLEQSFMFGLAGVAVYFINKMFLVPYKQMPLDQLPSLLISYQLPLVIALIGAVFYLLSVKKEDFVQRLLMRLSSVLKIFIIAVIVLGVVFSAYCVIYDRQLPIFNNRINIWRGALAAFSHMSGREKLIGVGPGCVAPMLDRYAKYQGVSRTTAHNEILEYLVSLGIIGLAVYVSLWVVTIRLLYKQKKVGSLAVLIAYIASAMVVGPSFLNSVTVYTLLSLFTVSGLTKKIPRCTITTENQ